MAWGKIDDGMMDHRKIDAALDAGGPWVMVVWLRGLCYVAKSLTDGEITPRVAKRLLADAEDPAGALEALLAPLAGCEHGLWEERAGSYWIHDYLDYNPTRAKVLAEREAARKRQETSRAKRKGESPGESPGESLGKSRRDTQGDFEGESPLPRTRTRTPSRPDLPSAAAADLGTSEDGPPPELGQPRPGQEAGKQARPKGQEADAVRMAELMARNAAHAEITARWCEGLAIRPNRLAAAQALDLKRAVVDHGPAIARGAVEKVLRFRHPSTALVLRLCSEGLFEDPTPRGPPADLGDRIAAAAGGELEAWPTAEGWKAGDAKAWARIQASLGGNLNDHVFATYFGPLTGFLELDGRRALVAANPFLCRWIADNYLEFLTTKIDEALGDGGAVEILSHR